MVEALDSSTFDFSKFSSSFEPGLSGSRSSTVPSLKWNLLRSVLRFTQTLFRDRFVVQQDNRFEKDATGSSGEGMEGAWAKGKPGELREERQTEVLMEGRP